MTDWKAEFFRRYTQYNNRLPIVGDDDFELVATVSTDSIGYLHEYIFIAPDNRYYAILIGEGEWDYNVMLDSVEDITEVYPTLVSIPTTEWKRVQGS